MSIKTKSKQLIHVYIYWLLYIEYIRMVRELIDSHMLYKNNYKLLRNNTYIA